ncbi:E7.6.2.1 [Lepeophtheirus salmonis]|uniref:E7.6.2.1 n=1 Tax=Lepeophtheirus salmonis TaxID=72036 RepID=A0A7R8HCD9_LEPSM|nr:E7.6.2.1 [Lepeophtheirus salmonis]CAF3006146.1 E7.6.2.1 [Lepeophtheirus salmonis]
MGFTSRFDRLQESQRDIIANDRAYNNRFNYSNNHIKTSKYSFLTFLPLNLFEQFQRLANFYFLCLLILQLIPVISSLTPVTTAVPLIGVLSLTAIKDAYDDIQRHQTDRQVNNRKSKVLRKGQLVTEKWHRVEVGDVIRMENNQFIAADILLLSSQNPNGLCYIETAELDGETNLKSRQCVETTSLLGDDVERLSKFNGHILCEPPNNNLSRFEGTLTWEGKKHPLDNEKLLLRGAILRIVFFLLCMCLFCTIACGVWETLTGRQFTIYLPWASLIPKDEIGGATVISLLVFFFFFLRHCLKHCCANITLCQCGSLCGDFEENDVNISSGSKKCDFFFKSYERAIENAEEFFRLLAVCHTVMPEINSDGNLEYQAQSPDENALVSAARNFGFVFTQRSPRSITILSNGISEVYELLCILDFNNVRKRMSVILKRNDKIRLYCKGADTVILQRLAGDQEDLKSKTQDHLDKFASEGLRTLVVGYKDLTESQFEDWKHAHHEAAISLEDREEKLDNVYDQIENNLKLLGATAIEDKLQDGVAQTISNLNLAGIKIWVLTGDKQETAINIGYSCQLLRDDLYEEPYIIDGQTFEAVQTQLLQIRNNIMSSMNGGVNGAEKQHEFIKDGNHRDSISMLTFSDSSFFSDDERNNVYYDKPRPHFPHDGNKSPISVVFNPEGSGGFALIRNAKLLSVVESHLYKKAQVVELVKKYKKAVTLAIGDGANDVSMIKTAHIGVGISGQEGMQAVLASDYSLAQFRFLEKTVTRSRAVVILQNCPNSARSHVHCCAYHNKITSEGLTLSDHMLFGSVVSTILVVVVTAQIALDTSYWTIFNHITIWGSLIFYFLLQYSYNYVLKGSYIGSLSMALEDETFWFTCLLTTSIILLPVVAWRFYRIDVHPTLTDKVRLLQRHAKAKPKETFRPFSGRRSRRSVRSGYAFAHQEGFGRLITSGKIMRPMASSTVVPKAFKGSHTKSSLNGYFSRNNNNSEHNNNFGLAAAAPGQQPSPRTINLNINGQIREVEIPNVVSKKASE